MTSEEARAGIATYQIQQSAILTEIDAHECRHSGRTLTQDAFDAAFGNRPFGVAEIKEDSFLLSGLGAGRRGMWFELLQYMVIAGTLRAGKVAGDNRVLYRKGLTGEEAIR